MTKWLLASALLLGAGHFGCSEGEGTPAATGGAGGAPTEPAESIVFDPSTTLRLAPGEHEELVVRVEPAGFFPVEFSLLAGSALAFDGYLEERSLVTSASGVGSNVLVAPSTPATFVVRAEVAPDVYADRAVSVSAEGFGTIVAVPKYAGDRSTPLWTASVRAGVTCAELSSFWEDGPLAATGEREVTVQAVPVGPVVSVVVRAERAVGGCATLTGLASEETRRLEIGVSDRPLRFNEGTLNVELDLNLATSSLSEFFASARSKGLEAFLSAHGTDAEALVADMAESLEADDERLDFETQASAFDFEGLVEATLLDVTGSALGLRSAIDEELFEAEGQIQGPSVFTGRLELGPSPIFFLNSAGNVSAELGGFLGAEQWSVSSEAGDVLVLGGPLTFEATRWLTAIAGDVNEGEGVVSPASRISAAIGCEAVAAAFVDAAGSAYSGCDAECTEDLCERAVERGWQRVGAASASFSTLVVGITGDAEVDDEARPESVDGTWVGALDGTEAMMSGDARAELELSAPD